MDTLRPTKYALIVKVSGSAYVLKGYFGTSTKCVDYTGMLIFKRIH